MKINWSAVAKELNKALELTPPIDLEAGTVEKEVRQIITEEVKSKDLPKFTPSTQKVVKSVLGGEEAAAKPAAKESEEAAKPEAKKAAAKPAAKAKKTKEPSEPRYLREHSLWDALKDGPAKGLTVEELAERGNKLYVKHGGKDNVKQSEHVVTASFLKIVVCCGAAKMDGDRVKVA